MQGLDPLYADIHMAIMSLKNVIAESNIVNENICNSINNEEQKKTNLFNKRDSIKRNNGQVDLTHREDLIHSFSNMLIAANQIQPNLSKEFLEKLDLQYLENTSSTSSKDIYKIIKDMNVMSKYFTLLYQEKIYEQELKQYFFVICEHFGKKYKDLTFKELDILVSQLTDCEYYVVTNPIQSSVSVECFKTLYYQYSQVVHTKKEIEIKSQKRLKEVNKNHCCKAVSEGYINQQEKSFKFQKLNTIISLDPVNLEPTQNCIHSKNENLRNYFKSAYIYSQNNHQNQSLKNFKINIENMFKEIKKFNNPTSQHTLEVLNYDLMHKILNGAQSQIDHIKARDIQQHIPQVQLVQQTSINQTVNTKKS